MKDEMKKKGAPSAGETGRIDLSARNLWSGILFGVGLVTFLDETVFHQLLHWHKFYDKATTGIGLVSDGLFHAFSMFATLGASYLFADLRRRGGLRFKRWLGGLLFGAGVFQFYDGTIQHKVMRLHQIRYGVDPMPYDLAWNVIAAGLILAGVVLLARSSGGEARAGSGEP